MRVIVGFGNPGDMYKGTRHNVGFETVDKLCFDFNISMKKHRRFRAFMGEGHIGGVRVVLVKPQTYMNLSGESVQSVLGFYKLPPSELIVVYDDVNIPLGDVRVRERGSAAGQKGMINTIAHLRTEEFLRVRIGIGEKPPGMSLSDYVLTRFLREEWELMIQGITRAGDAIDEILKNGAEAAMNIYNRKTKVQL